MDVQEYRKVFTITVNLLPLLMLYQSIGLAIIFLTGTWYITMQISGTTYDWENDKPPNYWTGSSRLPHIIPHSTGNQFRYHQPFVATTFGDSNQWWDAPEHRRVSHYGESTPMVWCNKLIWLFAMVDLTGDMTSKFDLFLAGNEIYSLINGRVIIFKIL